MSLELLEVTARDSTLMQASIIRPNEPDPDPVEAELMGGVVPVVAQLAWVETSRAGWVVMGTHHSVELPKAAMRSSNTKAAGATEEVYGFDVSATTIYDTDFDGTNSMASLTNSRLTCRWPGKFLYGCSVFADPSTTALTVARIMINGATYIGAAQAVTSGDANYLNFADVRNFVAGDFIDVRVSASSTSIFGTASNQLGVKFFMVYQA